MSFSRAEEVVQFCAEAGGSRLTAPNGDVVLSDTGNKTATFHLSDAATNGDAGAEVADATAINHCFTFAVLAQVTKV
jgi:hypothetical protein